MNKNKLKTYIKNFATNVALAAIMGSLALTYVPLVIEGEGIIWLLVADIVCCISDTIFACRDWKKIKKMLEESE